MRRARRGFLIGAGALLAAGGSAGALAQEVSLSGTNTLRFERYDTRGATGASPYPFSVDTGYDEFVFNLGWQPSSFDRWRGLIAGVVNDSPYRSRDRDVVPERLAFSRENGEAAVPYRVEAGDFFAFTSFRTQQRALKGVSVELQPVAASDTLRSSILLFGGAFQNSWRHLQWKDDNAFGLSWLTELAAARVHVNLLRNERDSVAGGRRQQRILSLAGEAPLPLGAANLRIEAELAAMRGDHDGIPGATTTPARDKSDTGSFVQLSGNYPGSTLSWRLRGERYGQDYRPFGASIIPDRRAAEAHLSWTSATALNLRARLQDFRDQYQSTNPQDTRVAGIGVSGPLTGLGATVSLDAFNQSLQRRDRSLDQDSLIVNASLAKPIDVWFAQLNLLWQRQQDHVLADNNPRTRQVGISVLRPLTVGIWSGSIGPGLTWRNVSGSAAATRDLTANLALNLSGGPHRLALSAGRLAQNPGPTTASDVATINAAFDYRFRTGRHEFGVDFTQFDRRPKPGEKTEAYKAGLTWVIHFDRAAAPGGRPAATVASIAASTEPLTRNAGLLSDIAPGAELAATVKRLADAGVMGGVQQGDALVFEARLLNEVEQRQRLALVQGTGVNAGRIERVGLIVALNDAGNAEEAGRVYERVLRTLIDRFGRPTNTFEAGAFSANFARDIASGSLIRIAEWTTGAGTLRLGIPRRLDGTARIEVQHAKSFSSPRESSWSIEAVK